MEKERILNNLDSSISKIELLKYFVNNEKLKTELFRQYTATETQPDLGLYFRKYFTVKEWSEEIVENNINIPETHSQSVMADFAPVSDFEKKVKEIEKEFSKLVLEEKLPKDFYSHSIEGTKIYRILSLVHISIENFKKRIIDSKDFNLKEYAEAFSKRLIKRMEEIEIPELTNIILKDFVSDNENAHIDAIYIVSGILRQNEANPENEIRTQYGELKTSADNAINEYLEKLGEKKLRKNEVEDFKHKKKVGHKYYSLLYWIELNANGKTPPMNLEGEFIRSEIEKIGTKKIGKGTGQEFYRAFERLKKDLNNTLQLKNNFGDNWKQTIIDLSNNDEKIIEYIAKQYPE